MRGLRLREAHREAGEESGDEDGGADHVFVADSLEGLVGVSEGEGLEGGREADIVCDLEEVVGVLPGHVGDAADLAFLPEERVVVEGGHLIEMDGVDGEDTAFVEGLECGQDDAADGGEGDGGVEADGREIEGVSDPGGTECGGLLLVAEATGGDVDLAVPGLQDGKDEAGERRSRRDRRAVRV